MSKNGIGTVSLRPFTYHRSFLDYRLIDEIIKGFEFLKNQNYENFCFRMMIIMSSWYARLNYCNMKTTRFLYGSELTNTVMNSNYLLTIW